MNHCPHRPVSKLSQCLERGNYPANLFTRMTPEQQQIIALQTQVAQLTYKRQLDQEQACCQKQYIQELEAKVEHLQLLCAKAQQKPQRAPIKIISPVNEHRWYQTR